MPFPTIVAHGTYTAPSGGANTATPGVPAGTAAGDFMVAVLHCAGGTTYSTPSGWSYLGTASDTNNRITVFYKVAGASETATTFTASGGFGSFPGQARVTTFRDVDNSDPFEGTTWFGANQLQSMTFGAVTTANDDCLIVNAIVAYYGAWNFQSWTGGNTSNFAERYNNSTTAGNDGGIALATGELATAGSSGSSYTWYSGVNWRSAGVTFALNYAPAGPSISVQPEDAVTSEGGSVTMSVTATASAGALSYQWYEEGVAMSGETDSTLVLSPVVADDFNEYYCEVTDDNGSRDSDVATIRVYAYQGPTISVQPEDTSVGSGSDAVFSVTAAAQAANADNADMEVCVRFDDTTVVDETGNYTILNSPATSTTRSKWKFHSWDSGSNHAEVAVPGSIFQSDFTLEFWYYVTGPTSAGSYFAHAWPGSGGVPFTLSTNGAIGGTSGNLLCATYNASWGVRDTGVAPTQNQWQFYRIIRNGNSLKMWLDGTQILDSTMPLTVPASAQNLRIGEDWNVGSNRVPGQMNDFVIYGVDTGETTSVPTGPTIVDAGTGLSYQWREDGVDMGGETSSSVTVLSVDILDDGTQYSVEVTDSYGAVVSDAATLNVTSEFLKGDATVDAKYRALLALGYDAPLPEMEAEWLLANGATATRPLPEMWSEMLASKGYGYPYSLQKAWELVLIDEGYTGTLPEMTRQFWIDGGTFA